MSSAGTTLRLLAALERDDRRKSPVHRPVETPECNSPAPHARTPYNLDLLQLAQDHDANLAAYVARHGGSPVANPADRRTDRGAREMAGLIAVGSQEAAFDLAALELSDSLRVALVAGDGERAVQAISCPRCFCYSLLAVPVSGGSWRAACRNLRCAIGPHEPRVWTLRQIAEHHLRDTRAA
ncbi:hypothetical protein KCMC57_64640 (plasmid) [Kitasatospora sp. CMC57]|uniref:Uncharacterized protein n=1 Tax=Kitasatospora sp. CMC57 TaxID=3231513 RepID=A0AB33K873_9ACTN